MTHPATQGPTGNSAESRWLLPHCQFLDGKTDTTQSKSHTEDIYLLSKPQQGSNYSKLSSYILGFTCRHTHTHAHTNKDRCLSRHSFNILQHGGDGARGGGDKNQIHFVCGYVGSATVSTYQLWEDRIIWKMIAVEKRGYIVHLEPLMVRMPDQWDHYVVWPVGGKGRRAVWYSYHGWMCVNVYERFQALRECCMSYDILFLCY